MNRHKGFMLIDATMGLILLGIIAGTLAVAMRSQQAGMFHLAHQRQAGRLAENGMTFLQSGRKIPSPVDPMNRIQWRKLSTPAPAGMVWAEVDASAEGQHEQLIGLVPETASEVRQ